MMISAETIRWLAEICDGDARIALNSLQLALNTVAARQDEEESALKRISLDEIKEGIKASSGYSFSFQLIQCCVLSRNPT